MPAKQSPASWWKGEDVDTGRIEFDEHQALEDAKKIVRAALGLDKKKEPVLMDMADRQKPDAA